MILVLQATEFQTTNRVKTLLLEYTTSENIGKWDTAPVDFGGSFGAGKVLRSKKCQCTDNAQLPNISCCRSWIIGGM